MNVLYIIGNGLDITHHMKTSYQDFFKYYLTIESNNKDIEAMKDNIDRHRYETWADLEIGMGAYASLCPNKDVFLDCLADIKANLKEYLKKESEKIALYKISSIGGFHNPRLYLDPEPRNRYDIYGLGRQTVNNDINVITFNYTSTLETLLNYKNVSINYPDKTRLRNIQHVHGLLDNMMVMGVNDSSQISNEGFNTDMDVIEEFVKPEYNDACMNNKNGICESLIRSSEVIVLYGTSLGLSDDKWWKIIGGRMQSDNYPLLVYLPYDEKKDQLAEPNHLRRWTMEYVREIRDKFGIQLEEKVLASRICIAINKPLFQITKTTPQSLKTR